MAEDTTTDGYRRWKLKAKYRRGGMMNKGRTDAAGHSGKSHRKKLSQQQKLLLKPQVKRCFVINAGGGKGRFVDYDSIGS